MEYLSWRAIFFFMLPLTALGTLCTLWGMPKGQIVSRNAKIDWVGTALLTVATMALLYLLSMGGKQFPWLSLQALALLVISAVSLFLLIRVEKRGAAPIVPLHLFKNKIFQLPSISRSWAWVPPSAAWPWRLGRSAPSSPPWPSGSI